MPEHIWQQVIARYPNADFELCTFLWTLVREEIQRLKDEAKK